MASNVVWRRDANDNYIPDKAKAGRHRKRIDGISALVDAIAAAEFAPPPPPNPYKNHGVMFI
jgi:phage terminase large subunit-like protein